MSKANKSTAVTKVENVKKCRNVPFFLTSLINMHTVAEKENAPMTGVRIRFGNSSSGTGRQPNSQIEIPGHEKVLRYSQAGRCVGTTSYTLARMSRPYSFAEVFGMLVLSLLAEGTLNEMVPAEA